MRISEPVFAPWEARLGLGFGLEGNKTILREKRFEGPLVLQKPFYPEGPEVCHAIVVHPPGGIAGGDELALDIEAGEGARVLATTPGAGKWYRSAGPWAKQALSFDVRGTLEWLPRETIVFDGALARLESRVRLHGRARYIGWELLCLGRTGSGERFARGAIHLDTRIERDGRLLWLERGRLDAAGRLLQSPAGLGGRTVCGTLVATVADSLDKSLVAACRELAAVTALPGLLIARILGDSSEEAMAAFTRIWTLLRPAVLGREAVPPRIWST